MSFEEWWNTKDYPARCKGNCKEAYEAGLQADVHTDNSAVIAELKNKIADIKANCDLAIEGRDVKVMELEKENAELKTDYGELQDKLEEEQRKNNGLSDNLTKAKEVIKSSIVLLTKPRTALDTKTYLMKAEQFLNEVEKC